MGFKIAVQMRELAYAQFLQRKQLVAYSLGIAHDLKHTI
jgi:hypothetical protein